MAIEPGGAGARFPPPFIHPGALLLGLAAERFEHAVALAIPHPLTFMRRLTHPAQLRRRGYMGLCQLPGSGWVAATRDLALIDRLWRQWSPGFSLDPALQAERHEHLRASMPAPLLPHHGTNDGCILPAQVDDRHRFAARHAMEVVPDVGLFLHIEAPRCDRGTDRGLGTTRVIPLPRYKGAS